MDRDEYKKELESEIDVLEDVVEIFMDASNDSKNEYVGKLLPTKIVIRTRFPENWNSESFRKTMWERINIRIPKGKMCEDGKEN